MTSQAGDYLIFMGNEYELLGDYTRQLPMLDRFDIEPIMMHTACYRGYIARYTVDDEKIYLEHLQVRDANKQYPLIAGVKPIVDYGVATYKGLREPMPLSGQIVIGKELAGFHPPIRNPHDYRIVLRLKFEIGKHVLVEDISVKAALIRQQMIEIRAERESLIDDKQKFAYLAEEMSKLYKLSFVLAHGITQAEENSD